jgi:OPA family sugar phosphate sensor protein UhpC-like MFS transporter
VFKGNRAIPVLISGVLCLFSLAAFLFMRGGIVTNIVYVSLFSLAMGVLYCVVGGLMALDIVPRKATGAALGIVGITSYVAASLQDVISGSLIQQPDGSCEFGAARWFWMIACVLSIILPVVGWNALKKSK